MAALGEGPCRPELPVELWAIILERMVDSIHWTSSPGALQDTLVHLQQTVQDGLELAQSLAQVAALITPVAAAQRVFGGPTLRVQALLMAASSCR